MHIIYFDICSIPLFLIILFVCYSRRMTKGTANRLFILVVFLSLISTAADLGMEIAGNMAPLSETGRAVCAVFSYIYLIVRNANNAALLLFLLALTRTTFLLRKLWAKIAFFLPYACILIMLAQNPFTHNAFVVTEAGYARAPLMYAFYGIALLYGLIGLAYCIYCRRYLPANKWAALLSIYVLVHFSVLVQFFRPDILVELFCTAVGEMVITLSIMRPEERMDSEVGMLSWASYQADLRNIMLSGEHVQIAAIRIRNSAEMRNFLGEHNYNRFLSTVAAGIRGLHWKRPGRIEIYFERPGIIYLITDEGETGAENVGARLDTEGGEAIRRYAEAGVRFDVQTCLIRCPDDLRKAEDVISLGHIFQKFGDGGQAVFRASEIVSSRGFAVEAHIEEILDRAIRGGHIEMYYQPIYDVRSGRFRSAEALARIVDPEYGMISPAVFIPAAEALGYIVPIGDAVLEQVFRFLSTHDPDALGLSYAEINLSVAQCMEHNLPEKIRALQEKYGVDPARINLEITETTFENVNETMLENVGKLIEMGYSFALDDYGIGYSSIQRVNRIPLALIKIDKSMLDEISSPNGRIILEQTVRMMQNIGKQLVVEGAETPDTAELLKDMKCDFIQGFFYSRPLPADAFLRFMEAQNAR